MPDFNSAFTQKEIEQCKAIARGDVTADEDDALWHKLYAYYQQDMPYGTQKARTGDPAEFVQDKLEQLFGVE